MALIKQQLLDKSKWKKGVWQQESDFVRWIDMLTHYPCLMIRSKKTGVWCGYVGVSHDHTLYTIDLVDETYRFLDVHGGVSFAGRAKDMDLWLTPADIKWWIGFDCQTKYDLRPISKELKDNPALVYRTEEFVFEEVTMLAQQVQLLEIAHTEGYDT